MSIGIQSSNDRDRQMVRAFKKAVIASVIVHVLFLVGVVVFSGLDLRSNRRPPVIGVNFYAPPGGKKGGGDKKNTVPVKKPTKPKTPDKSKEVKKPETKKPETKKPEAKKTEVKKPETKKEEKKEVKKDPKPEDKKKEIAKNDLKKDEPKPDIKEEPNKDDTKKEEAKKDEPKEEDPKKDETKEEPPVPDQPEEDVDNFLRDVEDDAANNDDNPGTGPSDLPGVGDSPFDGAINGLAGDPALAAYFGQVMNQILTLLRIPPSVPVGRGLQVDVYIHVDADGNVLDYKVDSLSGNKALDNAVTTMLDELKKLPAPPPDQMSGDRFELPIRFEPGG